ncbi:RNA-directed DNA polymerase [Adlercreutzia faecimuris]|uniref:RNA-directed DNA polymerase n=1 Tax=Adlercreutzia faecimuris TaxID=2897341 RepID=A0ABS9WJC2_9ACTN|nr:RNA-directed DNA polymerase [Adlercreutzia sp. JBNU-10]MCI2242341.1 RNA-directed DNA polymerase [Adlercreutzia sp. JBNU-10]
MDEISSDDLYTGLLGYGLFADKLPPMFTSKSFAADCVNSKECRVGHEKSDWVVFSYIRNIGTKRVFGIPSPFAYESLVRHLVEHWKEIKEIFRNNTQGHPYRISRIHIRKRKDSDSLFSMNYRCWQIEENPLPALLIGNRMAVDCDISRCFPSIYTHALDWAILGKEKAKRNTNGTECRWSHELDQRTMNTTNGETHGLLIGPHTSNLLAELILTRIDAALFEKGYRFLRHIDDYRCYVDSKERARSFILDLETELDLYGLSVNQKKTRVWDQPSASLDDWVRILKNAFPHKPLLDKGDVERFLDTAIVAAKESGSGSALAYAFGMLSKSRMNHWARKYYGDIALHLAYTQPYLLPFVEERVIMAAKIPSKRIEIFSNLLLDKSIEERDYLSASYAIYYAMRYGFALALLESAEAASVLEETRDCVLCTCALVYSRRRQNKALRNKLISYAKELAKTEGDFQRNWLFVYEALPIDQIPKEYLSGAWRAIKRKGISFIDTIRIEEPPRNNESIEDVIDALAEQLSDDGEVGADRASDRSTNEL